MIALISFCVFSPPPKSSANLLITSSSCSSMSLTPFTVVVSPVSLAASSTKVPPEAGINSPSSASSKASLASETDSSLELALPFLKYLLAIAEPALYRPKPAAPPITVPNAVSPTLYSSRISAAKSSSCIACVPAVPYVEPISVEAVKGFLAAAAEVALTAFIRVLPAAY